MLVSPYFKGRDKNDKIILTESFYVKLKTLADTVILNKQVKEDNLVILEQNEYMPLWFTVACTQTTNGNSLFIANKFYESNRFAAADPDLRMNIQLTNDPLYNAQWGLENLLFPGNDIRVNQAWRYTKGDGIKVAVIDHGIELQHPDLAANIHNVSYDSESGQLGSVIWGNHGTACAGIIGAIENNIGIVGVAPQSTLISISNELIISNKASCARAIDWAWSNGADVISNSWGHIQLRSDLIRDAIRNAVTNGRGGKGCVVVFATGNDSNSSVSFPAEMSEVISVGAINQIGTRANFSNFGAELNVVAPGVGIVTTDRVGANGYVTGDYTFDFSGTSASCPHVAGIAALVLSIDGSLTQQQVRNIIEDTAQKSGGYNYNINKANGTWNSEMGFGLVDADAAVRRALGYKEIVSPNDLYRRSKFLFKLRDGSSATWSCTNIPCITINSSTGLLNNTNFDYTGNITITAVTPIETYTKVVYISHQYIDGQFIFNNVKKSFSEIHSNYPVYENGFDLYTGFPPVSNLIIEITDPGLSVIEGKAPIYTWTKYSMLPHFYTENNGTRIRFSSFREDDEAVEIELEIETGKGTMSQMFYLNTGRFSPILYPFGAYRLSPLEVKLTDNTITVSESAEQERGVSYTNLADNNSYIYEILDILGTYKMQKGNFKLYIGGTQDIDISTLPKGFYALTIYKNGERVHSEKFKK